MFKTIGATAVAVVDQQGDSQSVNFDAPTDVPMFYEVRLTINSNYPQDQTLAAVDIKQAIKDFGEANFGIGAFLSQHKFIDPIDDAATGIADMIVFQDRDVAATAEINIALGDQEKPTFDVADMIVTIIAVI